jgi:hypothetical protein
MIANEFARDTMNGVFEKSEKFTDVVFFYGSLNQEIVNSTLRIIDQKLSWLNFSKSLISRTKLVGVELMENMHKHQTKSYTVSPYFVATLNSDGLSIHAGNSVSPNDYVVLMEKLALYNEMSLDELRKLYTDKLGREQIDMSGNMGLGLITIINRSNKKAAHELVKISDNEYFFKMQVLISNTPN